MHNESEKGNLKNWFKCIDFCDASYIYDQGSTDNSHDIYTEHKNCFIMQSETNDFGNEIYCKDRLLKKLLLDHPDVDWIFWMDGDTLLDGRILRDIKSFHKILNDAKFRNIDSLSLGHYNLWRSDIHYRVDDQYHGLSAGVTAFWRNTGNLKFNLTPGLHARQYPMLNNTMKVNYDLIHRGFATDFQIMKKYDVYKSFGQTGYNLERLLNEHSLDVRELPEGLLPDWFEKIDVVDPRNKEKIREIYNKSKGI